MQLQLKPRAWWRVPAQVFGGMTGKKLGCSYGTEETDPEDRRELGSRHECRSVTDKPVTIPLGKGKILKKKTQKRQVFFCRLAKGAREKAWFSKGMSLRVEMKIFSQNFWLKGGDIKINKYK